MSDHTLDRAQLETLIALVERGPLWDGDAPSKRGCDDLIVKGLAVRVVVRGEDGWTAATSAGHDAYKAAVLDDARDLPAEARAWRTARCVIRRAQL